MTDIEEPAPEPPSTSTPEVIEEPLPRLEESDDAVRDAVGDIPLGTTGQQYLIPGNIIERSASLIYLMAQGDVPYKLLCPFLGRKPHSPSATTARKWSLTLPALSAMTL